MRGPTGPAIKPTLGSLNNVASSTLSKFLSHLIIFILSNTFLFVLKSSSVMILNDQLKQTKLKESVIS